MKSKSYIFIALLLLCVSCQPTADTKSHSVGFDISQSGDTTHIGFIHELGMMDKVVGVPRPDRVYSFTAEDRLRIKDLGDDLQPNLEAILLTQPDAVIISTYSEGDELPRRLEALGIPIFYCNEWTETTPLARAEWIRFFGACLGCQPKADSIYNAVSEE